MITTETAAAFLNGVSQPHSDEAIIALAGFFLIRTVDALRLRTDAIDRGMLK